MRSPPRPPRSRSLSPHRIAMTTTHTCWWIPRSRISRGDTSVCLRGMSIKEIISSAFNGRGHKKSISEALLELISLVPPTHLILHHSSQLILPSHPPLKRCRKIMKYCKCTVGYKENPPPHLLSPPICSLWHKVGLIQITLLPLGSPLSIIHVLLTVQPKASWKGIKG